MSFQKKLNMLEHLQLQKPDKMLTVYLNTDRSDPDQQNGKWKIALKTGLKRIEEYLEASNEEEKERFKALRTKVEAFVYSMERKLPKGIIIFASEDSGIWEAFELQVPVETHFYWEETPALQQLKSLHRQYPYTALILTQQYHVKIIEAAFGQLLQTELLEFDIETEDWRKYERPQRAEQSMGGNSGRATQQDLFETRLRINQQRWWKGFGSTLDKKAAENRWERIILVGDKEITDTLHGNMNKDVFAKVQKNLLNENEHKVIEELLA